MKKDMSDVVLSQFHWKQQKKEVWSQSTCIWIHTLPIVSCMTLGNCLLISCFPQIPICKARMLMVVPIQREKYQERTSIKFYITVKHELILAAIVFLLVKNFKIVKNKWMWGWRSPSGRALACLPGFSSQYDEANWKLHMVWHTCVLELRRWRQKGQGQHKLHGEFYNILGYTELS